MDIQELAQASDNLLLIAEQAAKKPLMQRGEAATEIITALCAMNVQLVRKVQALEPYADEQA